MLFSKSVKFSRVMILVLLAGAALTMSACGSITTTNSADDVSVTAIVVTGAGGLTVIDTIGGTLQMSALITPTDATDATVVWTLQNGTGIGSINSTGILSAVTNGTVTVRATSVSDNTVSGTLLLTFSNQVEVDMDSTLTSLTSDGIMVMGFSPLSEHYIMVLSSGTTSTPLVEAIKYAADATMVIIPASDVTSTEIANRTTTITVTTADGLTTKVYEVVFESAIANVELGTADDFVMLATTGISTATTSIITGNIGVSPAAATYITGFSLILDSTGIFATSSQIVGQVFASDYISPTPSQLTTAISDMQTAYTDASGRAANYNELYAGDLSGKTLTSGVYKFGTSVLINTDLTLTGSATDIWIFQISGQLTQAAGIQITLAGGALAKNIFWVVADTVAIGTGAHFEGTILAMTNISMGTNASINGNLYSQTAITLDACIVDKK
ncbi:MAG: ice-binding family protein [Candidatus Izemoplasmatales bacterium]